MITRILLTPPAATAACVAGDDAAGAVGTGAGLDAVRPGGAALQPAARQPASTPPISRVSRCREDRKSTRLNSSHSQISYAVFCLKKKKNKNIVTVILEVHRLSSPNLTSLHAIPARFQCTSDHLRQSARCLFTPRAR